MAVVQGEAFATGVGTLVHGHVWVARDFKGNGKFKYSADIVFSATDPANANIIAQHEQTFKVCADLKA